MNIYNVWQPSLVLGRPARALTGPYSLRRLYTGLGTPSLLRQINIQAHSLEVSKKEVTSVSDSSIDTRDLVCIILSTLATAFSFL